MLFSKKSWKALALNRRPPFLPSIFKRTFNEQFNGLYSLYLLIKYICLSEGAGMSPVFFFVFSIKISSGSAPCRLSVLSVLFFKYIFSSLLSKRKLRTGHNAELGPLRTSPHFVQLKLCKRHMLPSPAPVT